MKAEVNRWNEFVPEGEKNGFIYWKPILCTELYVLWEGYLLKFTSTGNTVIDVEVKKIVPGSGFFTNFPFEGLTMNDLIHIFINEVNMTSEEMWNEGLIS